jgi:hypothetical protein
MGLQIVGAGLGRTGTHSLQLALQQLLDGRCYHMIEVFGRPDDIAVWHDAINGQMPDWNAFLSEYRATVDWPASAFWREIADANPDAIVLLSSRDTASWWKSANNTIFNVTRRENRRDDPMLLAQMAMIEALFEQRFTKNWTDEAEACRAFEAHNAAVRAAIPADRLIDYRPGDGWKPICDKLGLPIPSEPFPHVNTTDEFRAMTGMDPL